MKCHKIHIIAAAMVLVMASFKATLAGDRQLYEIQPQSRIVFNGTSNVNRFTFSSNTILGKGAIDTSKAIPEIDQDSIKKAIDLFFQVNVKTFDSGNSRMNRDMYSALKAEQHPYIEFELNSLQVEQFHSPCEAKALVQGTLRVAGVENTISFPITVTQITNDLYHLQGREQVRMTDHDVEPPTALFGLIQVRDNLTVKFDIYASQQVGNTVAVNQTRDENNKQFD